MAHHHRPPLNATHHWAGQSARWGKKEEKKHTVDQPTPARKAQLLMWLESNPAKFNEAVTQWRCANGNATLELGDETNAAMPNVDFTGYKAQQLTGISFKNITFRGAFLTDEPQAEQLFTAGANIVDSNYGEQAYNITRMHPKVAASAPAPASVAPSPRSPAALAADAAHRPTTAKERADADAAKLTAYARGNRGYW